MRLVLGVTIWMVFVRLFVGILMSFFSVSEGQNDPVISIIDQRVSEDANNMHLRPFTADEFQQAIFQMHHNKSPGLDGFNSTFYQKFWPLIGNDIFHTCVSWLNRVEFPSSLNATYIVLVPKCDNSSTMRDLWPISLCNVLYKIVAKVLENKLKDMLWGLISHNQSAFVPGRSILDNVLIVFEVIHCMKRKTKGSSGDVALKIDVSKSYDRVDWEFLRHIMLHLGFVVQWVNLLMLCVKSVSYSVIVND